MADFVLELWAFMRERKKFWLLPMILVLLLFGGLIVISNGPGDPKRCVATIDRVRRVMAGERPIFGICLGHEIMALAVGADTSKLTFRHRSQNQPCAVVGTSLCYITSQNQGYAMDERTLPVGWQPWFRNLNDGTNGGMRYWELPFVSVQFDPEAAPGPV